MTDEQRKVLHADLDRIIDAGGDPVIIKRVDLDHLNAIADECQKFSESLDQIAQRILGS